MRPASPGQRQYEALRAYFVEPLSTEQVARRFGYTAGSFRVRCHHFRRQKPDWFRELKRGRALSPKRERRVSSSWPCASRTCRSMTSSRP